MSRDGSLPAGVEHCDVDGHLGVGMEACINCGDYWSVDSLSAEQICPDCIKKIESDENSI